LLSPPPGAAIPSWSGSGDFVLGMIPALLPTTSRPRVGVTVRNSAQWAWVAQSAGFFVTWIWAQDTLLLPDWLRSVFPDTLYTTKDICLPAVDLLLCDGKPPRWSSSWNFDELVVSTGSSVGARYLPHGWNDRQRLTHQELGGLTTESTVVRAYSQRPRTCRPIARSFALPTAVYSVASDTILKGRRAARPAVRLLPTPKVLQIGGTHTMGAACNHPTSSAPLSSCCRQCVTCRRIGADRV
jgi:hypothetical protein